MRILVTNLTQNLRTIALPDSNGKVFARPFAPGEVYDLGPHINPLLLDTAVGQELRALSYAKPPKVKVEVIPDPADFAWQITGASRGDASGDSSIAGFEFDHTTPSPQILRALPAGSFVETVSVFVETPFDDPSASLNVGTAAIPSQFLSLLGSALGVSGQYQESRVALIEDADFLLFNLNPGASTQGGAYLFYKVKAST